MRKKLRYDAKKTDFNEKFIMLNEKTELKRK